ARRPSPRPGGARRGGPRGEHGPRLPQPRPPPRRGGHSLGRRALHVRIVLVSDHTGVEPKAALAVHLRQKGHEGLDLGPDSKASVDYPDFAEKGGKAIAAGKADRGVFMCGTGIGISIAANKVRGIRAALVYDENTVDMSRKHNDANVVCLGARVL